MAVVKLPTLTVDVAERASLDAAIRDDRKSKSAFMDERKTKTNGALRSVDARRATLILKDQVGGLTG